MLQFLNQYVIKGQMPIACAFALPKKFVPAVGKSSVVTIQKWTILKNNKLAKCQTKTSPVLQILFKHFLSISLYVNRIIIFHSGLISDGI